MQSLHSGHNCLHSYIYTSMHLRTLTPANAYLQDHQHAMMAHLPCASSRSAHAVSSGACGLPCAPRAKISLASSMLPSPASISAHSVSRGPFLQPQYCDQSVNTLKAQIKWLPLDRNLWYWSLYIALPSLHQMPTLSAEACYGESSPIVSAQAYITRNSQLPYAPCAETPRPSSKLPSPASTNAHDQRRIPATTINVADNAIRTVFMQTNLYSASNPCANMPQPSSMLPHQPPSMPIL